MLRGLTLRDLQAVMRIQAQAYPDVGHDSEEIFADKLERYPAGCLGIENEGRLAGYLFAHPWRLYQAATLDQRMVLPEEPDCYYLHDLAVELGGRGYARRLVLAGLRQAGLEGLQVQALVAVHSTQPFWRRFGFENLGRPSQALWAKLREYSADATYMLRSDR